jgi:CBS domain containing-hemolysin-like protein
VNDWLRLLAIALLFALGLRLSAFFSGSETGFYRLSLPRLMIDAQAGHKAARRLLWFAQHPAYFMATTLVGNNVAHYLITCAVSLAVVFMFSSDTEWVEIAATLLMAPVIFLLGELLPKSVYYRAPWAFLRREIKWLRFCFVLFLPATWPLVTVTRLLEKLRPGEEQPLDLVLGRNRLAQVVGHGHREGVLTEAQTRLAAGLLQVAPQSVLTSMIPGDRILGVDDCATREQVLDYARRFGLPTVTVRRADGDRTWYAYVRVWELALQIKPLPSLLHTLPQIERQASKLEALQVLRAAGEVQGAVVDQGRVLGIVNQRGLAEQMFRHEAGTVGMTGRRHD